MVEIISRPNLAGSGRLTPSSFPFYTSGEDNLRIVSRNALIGVRLKVNARTLDNAGTAKPDSWDHAPNSDRSAKVEDYVLSGATLLNLCVFASAGAPLLGQTFVSVQLVRGIGAAAIVLGVVLQGYVTASQPLAWPGSPIQNSLDSGGYLRTIVGFQPLTGNEVFETVPTGARWELLTLVLKLTTSSAVANRRFKLIVSNAPTRPFYTYYTVGTAANSVTTHIYAQNLGFSNANYVAGITGWGPLPLQTFLSAGANFYTSTEGMDVFDNWDAPEYLVREWLDF